MADEISSFGKDVNKVLYEEDRASRIAREMGYRGGEFANDIIKEIREDYLNATLSNDVATAETNEFVDNGLNTSTTENDDILNTLTDTETNEVVVDDNTENVDVNTNPVITSVEATEDIPNSSLDNVKESKLKTFFLNEQGQGISTKEGKKTDKVLLATGVVGKGLKVAKTTAKVGGGLIRFGKNFNVFDANGNVDGTKATGDQIKTAAKFVGRKTSKYANKVAVASSKKLMSKPVKKVSQKIATSTSSLSVKVSTKLSAKGMKTLSKISKFMIEFIGKVIEKIIAAIISMSPIALAIVLIVVVTVGVFSIFAPFADRETMEKFTTHINNTQTDFYEKIKGYYDDDYIVTGTYNGEAYIDWRAALSVIQALNANVDGSNGEIWLLKQMEKDGVMYSIDKVSCTPYYRHQTTKYATITGVPQYDASNDDTVIGYNYNVVFAISPNYRYVPNTYTTCTQLSNMYCSTLSNGGIYSYVYYSGDTSNNSSQYWATYVEGKYTDYIYQVSVGTLDDYKNWIKNNPDTIKTFYDKEGVNYDASTTNFLTTDVNDIMDSLYSSDSFDIGFISTDTKFSAQAVAGQVYDTGKHKGVLAYPTSSRKLSATFPYYSSGKEHTGIDFAVPMGTPICACYDGEVIVVKKLNYSYGHYVVLKHKLEDGKVIYTLYAHNSVLLVNEGDKVVQGQVIAKSGSTGNSTGPHCHLSVLTSWSPQTYVQPLDYL